MNDKSQEDNSKTPLIEEIHDFDKMGLSENLLRGIYGYGFEFPSSIQSKAIVPVTTGRDIIAQAQSGTGKTGTFSIGTLQRINPALKQCQAIILSHTQELATQIHSVFTELGKYLKINPTLCIGVPDTIREQRRELDNGSQAVIGTPGRVKDLIDRKYLNTTHIKIFVMDEADELLSVGFQEQIKEIIQKLPQNCQICVFSATLPYRVLKTTELFMNEPIKILVKPEKLTLEGIKQFYVNTEEESLKLDYLIKIYKMITISQSMIYTNTKKKAEWLYQKLVEANYPVSMVHGEMPKTDRAFLMKQFRTGVTRVLISTDLLCRGIDIQQVSIVINFDLPRSRESYIHRIGRSGRFGRKGVAINFITEYDHSQIDHLIKYFNATIEPLPEDIAKFL